jgi:hypothetical protein
MAKVDKEARAKKDAEYAAKAARLTEGMEVLRESCRKEAAYILRDINERDGIIDDRRMETLAALQGGIKALHLERFIYTLGYKDHKAEEDRNARVPA